MPTDARLTRAGHHHRPHARHRRRRSRPTAATPARRWGSRRSAGPSSPRHLRHAPGRPGVARPRPLRALGRARLDAALRAAAPDAATTCRWSELKRFRQLGSEHPRATPSAATPRASRSPPARWARASPTPSASRWPSAMLAARFNRPGHEIVDHRTWFICSDGDLMEGISHEAASIAGFLGLEQLDRDLRRQPHQPRRADQPGLRRGRARPASRPTAGGCCAWRTATTSRRSTRP